MRLNGEIVVTNADLRRNQLYQLLGDLPPRDRPIEARKICEEQRDGMAVENWLFDFNGLQDVPGIFVRPRDADGKRPTILYNHYHGGQYETGNREMIENQPLMQKPPYGVELTRLGYNVFCIDAWAFGQRRGRSESAIFKEFLWNGRVMWGMMVYDSLRAIDYICSREDVDANRLGTIGLSMGSTMAWWVAALDPRIKCCIDLCCLTDFHSLIETQNIDRHGVFYFVPSLLKHFTTAQINALIAPRAHLALEGNLDELTPVAGLDRIDAEMKQVYAAAGAPDAWKMMRWDVGHGETPEMRIEAVRFFQRWL
jgi:pimeloyl-ACP methyl ester carboxylesterase